MIDYTLLEYGVLSAEQEDFEFCYEAVRDDFFSEISGGDEYFEKAKTESTTSRKAKIASLIKDNKKKIAIIAGAAVAIIALAAILRRKGKDKAADATKKAGEVLQKTAKDDKKANDALEAQAKEVAKAVSAARIGGEAGAAERKEEAVLDKVEKLNAKVTKEAEAAQEKKEKTRMMLPAIIPTEKDTSEDDRKIAQAQDAVDYYTADKNEFSYKLRERLKRNDAVIEKHLAAAEKRYGKNSKQYREIEDRLEEMHLKNTNPLWHGRDIKKLRVNYAKRWRMNARVAKSNKEDYNNYVRAVNARNERERGKMTKEDFFDYICGDLFFE